MGVDLLKHNQEAYEKVQKAISDGKKKIAISHATGTGKSYLIAKLFEDYNNDKKLVLVPSTYICDQIQKLFEKYSIQNVDVILYQKLIKMDDKDIAAMDYDVVALDEYHHDAATKVWGSKVKTLIETHSETIFFGTSATPIKTDGVNAIDELFEGNCASDLPLSEGIAKKIVPLPKYVGALYTLDDELERLRKKVENATNTKEEKQEFYKKINAMRSQIEKSYGMPIILNKNIKNKEGKYIVFCKNKKHLSDIKETVIGWFRTAGCKNINAYIVHSSYENKDAEYKAFCDDTSHSLHLLFCVDMLNEGLHLKNISGVLLLRPTRSGIVWHQQIGRAIEANNTNTPVIIDAVNNFRSAGQGMKLFKEIRGAVEKEKKSNPNFDDSGFEDIDTFFVLEQVVEIQEMFKEIEGKLQGDWDLYIEALKQYKDREGDCDVSRSHIEILDGVSIKLGGWVYNMRIAKNGKGTCLLTREREEQLNQIEFIWDHFQFIFEKKVRLVAEYFKENKRYPFYGSGNLETENLAQFLSTEKMYMRKEDYPQYKRDIIEKYLPEFSCERKRDKQFSELIEYLKLYKYRYNNLDIKARDVIDGYKIGEKINSIKGKYNKKKLSKEKIRKLEEVGVYLGSTKERWFYEKMELAEQAVKSGVIISRTNEIFKGVDLYDWIRYPVKKKYKKNELTKEEIETIEKLTGKKLDGSNTKYEKNFDICREMAGRGININTQKVYKGVNIYNWIHNHKNQFSDEELVIINQILNISKKVSSSSTCKVPIKIVDILNDSYKEYVSISEAGRALHNEFNVVESDNKGIKAISNRLTGKIKNPVYKDRFRFEYANDKVG